MSENHEDLKRCADPRQQAVAPSQSQSADLHALAPVGHFTISEEGLILKANLTAARLLGVERSGLIGQSLPHLIVRDDLDSYHVHRKQLFETQQPQVCELRMLRKDGSWFWARMEATAAQDADSGSRVCLAVISDITDRKLAEESWRESEAKFRRLYHSMMDAFVSVDMNGYIQDCNQTFQALLGYSETELRQLTYRDITPEKWHAVEAAIVREQILVRGCSDVYEKEYRRKDGTVFPVELRTFLVRDNSGNPLAMWAIVRDITERTRAEEERKKTLSMQQEISLLQQSLLKPASLEDKLRATTDSIVRLFGAAFCRIWLIRPGDLCDQGCVHTEVQEGPDFCRYRERYLHLVASSGCYAHLDSRSHGRVPFGCYKIGRLVLGDDHTFLTNDVQNDPRIHDHQWARELGLVSFAGYQLLVPGQDTLGVLAIFAKHPISPAEDAMLDGLGSTLALVVQQACADDALRTPEAFLNSIIERSPHAMWISDRHGTLLRINQACRDLLHLTDDEVVGKYNVLQDAVVEEQGYLPLVRRVFEQGETVRFTIDYDSARLKTVELREPTHVVLDVTISPVLGAGGSVIHAIIQHVDITEQRRLEEARLELERFLRSTLDALASNIAILDANGTILHVNEAWRAFARDNGADPSLVSEGVSYLETCDLATGEDSEIARSFATGVRAVLGGDRDAFMLEYPCHGPNEERWFIGSVTRFPGKGALRVVVSHVNITAQRQAERQLRQREAELAQVSRLHTIGELAASLAHELNQPLYAISNYLGGIDLRLRKEDVRLEVHMLIDAVDRASREVGRAAGVVARLGDFVRRREPQRSNRHIGELLRGAVDLLQPIANDKGVTLEVVLDEDLPMLQADPFQIQQVIVNLLVNAFDAASALPANRRKVTITAGRSEAGGIEIVVRDYGRGISEDVRESLFEPFVTTKKDGLGVGLAISRSIVQSHGGTIWATPNEPHGAAFHFSQPTAQKEPNYER